MNDYKRARIAIDEDGDLSVTGRYKKHEANVREHKAKIAAFESDTITVLRERIAATDRALVEKASAKRPNDLAERIAYEFRLAEIRADLKLLEPAARIDALRNTNDPMVFDAALTAPPTLTAARPGAIQRIRNLMDDDQRAGIVMARAEAADSAAATLLNSLRKLVDVYTLAVNLANREIVAPPPPPGAKSDASVARDGIRVEVNSTH